MARPTGLKVIENKYCYNVWEAYMEDGSEAFSSVEKEFSQRRDVELYHLCGIYDRAGLPVETVEPDYRPGSAEQPYKVLTRAFSDEVYSGVAAGKAVLVAGGYCNYAPAILGGLQRAVGTDKRLGVIWVDAHSDNQIVEDFDEPIRLVGVPVSTMLGQTLPGYRKEVCGLEKPLDGRNMIISDARITLEDEEANMRSASVVRLTGEQFEDPATWQAAVQSLAERVDHIYFSVDVDILKPEYIPAYEVLSPGGHDIEKVMENIGVVMDTGKVNVMSVFCVDFDHYENGGEWTYLSGMKVIASALSRWSETPE